MSKKHSDKPPQAKDIAAQQAIEIQHASDILHLFHHRNKNQHQHSIWWRHFSQFRRHVNALAVEAECIAARPTTTLARAQKRKREPATRRRLASRRVLWERVAVARWSRAFSQIVADLRFATLGLVLLAALAQICAIWDLTFAEQEDDALLLGAEVSYGQNVDVRLGSTGSAGAAASDDVGEVVAREPLNAAVASHDEISRIATSEIVVAEPPSTKPGVEESNAAVGSATRKVKKRRKKGDAIDDLFSGLS